MTQLKHGILTLAVQRTKVQFGHGEVIPDISRVTCDDVCHESPVRDVTRVIGPGLGPGVTVAPEPGCHAGAPGVTVTPAPVLLLPLPGPVPRPVEVLLLPPVAPPAQALIGRVEGRALTVIPGVSLASAASDGHITSHTAHTPPT